LRCSNKEVAPARTDNLDNLKVVICLNGVSRVTIVNGGVVWL
jgi:hypothetical protein